jgi:hypothetical protein
MLHKALIEHETKKYFLLQDKGIINSLMSYLSGDLAMNNHAKIAHISRGLRETDNR